VYETSLPGPDLEGKKAEEVAAVVGRSYLVKTQSQPKIPQVFTSAAS
jgi:hypothetical protein